NGSIAPIAPRRTTARRTAEGLRRIQPHLVHLHEPALPGPCLSALIGYPGPRVAAFPASPGVGHTGRRPMLRSFMQRLTFRVVVSESARETAMKNWNGDDYIVLWNGIEIERFDVAPAPAARRAVLFIGRHEVRKGLAVLLDAWDGIEVDAELW